MIAIDQSCTSYDLLRSRRPTLRVSAAHSLLRLAGKAGKAGLLFEHIIQHPEKAFSGGTCHI
jgi:hypothetical protein